MDITTLEPGADFVVAIEDAVDTIDALIAVIGPSWISAADPQGNRRLDEQHDYVRLEIGNALRRRIRVIPVLVDGAQMPRELELPEDLQPLVRRNALELTLNQWRAGMDRLTQALDGIVTASPGTDPPRRRVDFGPLPFLVLVAAAALLSGIFVKAPPRVVSAAGLRRRYQLPQLHRPLASRWPLHFAGNGRLRRSQPGRSPSDPR